MRCYFTSIINMTQNILIGCSSTERVIAHKDSTKGFSDFVSMLELPNPDKIIAIFKRLKNKTGISDDEYDIFSLFLEHRKLSKVFNEFSTSRFVVKGVDQENAVSFWELKTYLTEILINSKLLATLQNETLRTRIVEVEWKQGICVLDEKRKQHFYEIITEAEDYWDMRDNYCVWKNIRSWKYVIFDTDTFDIIFTSRDPITLQNGYFENMMIDTYSGTHIFSQAQVSPVWKNIKYYEGKYHYYIIDFKWNRIHRIDKKHWTSWVETFPNHTIKDIFAWFLICETRNAWENPYKIMNIFWNCTDTWWWDEVRSYELIEWEDILKVVLSWWEEKYFNSEGTEIL